MKKPKNKRSTPALSKASVSKTGPKKDSSYKRNMIPYFQYACLAAIILFVLFVRSRMLSFPLERDEGEYALMGQLILKGIPPYEMAYNMKLPGTYYMYALFMFFFGKTVTGIHLGLLVTNVVSILLLFFIGKKLINQTVALIMAISFALLTLSPGIYGFAAHATHFNYLFALGGLLLLLMYSEKIKWPYLILSGFSFGMSFIMKQQAVFFLPFGFLALFILEWRQANFKWTSTLIRLAIFSATMVLPYILILLVAVLTGTFASFWHWTVEYARQYAGMNSMDEAIDSLKFNFYYMSMGCRLFWWTGLAGLIVLFFSQDARKNRWLILLFVVFSALCVIPGFYFRPHYFIAFLPALALLVGMAVNFLFELLTKFKLSKLHIIPILLFGFLVYQNIHLSRQAFFKDDPRFLSKRMYGSANPFPESIEIAKFIHANSGVNDKIAVLGSEPQIYFYSDRLPATGYIYTYPLMENQPYSREMQQDMINEIEKNQPKFLIMVNSSMSWLRNQNSANDIFDWYGRYRENYNLAGLVELNPNGQSTYVWREAVNNYQSKSESNIWIYERK